MHDLKYFKFHFTHEKYERIKQSHLWDKRKWLVSWIVELLALLVDPPSLRPTFCSLDLEQN